MKFIHISDLHFNPNMDGRATRYIRDGLIPYLHELSITADELLITGDFRHAKIQINQTQADVDNLVKYIKDIANAVSITDVKHIHIVPGNHDRSRNKNEALKMRDIRQNYDPEIGCFDKETLHFLLQKFDYFRWVCSTLYGPNNYWRPDELHTYRAIGDTVFLYLNTAIMHNCDEDRKQHRLIIGNDCFDRLMIEIRKKYTDFPVIVLAHHSPDYFEKKEKEAVEKILRDNPKVFLYLCGDANDAWLRKVNNHLEIAMGYLKHERNVKPTFLYGDTSSHEYAVHHWVGAWEPFAAANKQLVEFVPPFALPYQQSAVMSLTPSLTIKLDEDGKIIESASLRNTILQWIASGSKDDLHVILDIQLLIKHLSERLHQLQVVIDNEGLLKEPEETEYIRVGNEIERLKRWANLVQTACECFFKDRFMHIFCNISKPGVFLAMLSRIITFDYAEDRHRRNSNEFATIDFTVSRTGTNNEYYFSVPISRQTLVDMKLNPQIGFMDICLLGIDAFDNESRKYIYTYFYLDYAFEILFRDKTIREDVRTQNLLHYNLGRH